jgi:hypothetical protein
MYFFDYDEFLNPKNFKKYDISLQYVEAISYVYCKNHVMTYRNILNNAFEPIINSNLEETPLETKTYGILYKMPINKFNLFVKNKYGNVKFTNKYNYFLKNIDVIDNINLHIQWEAKTFVIQPFLLGHLMNPTLEQHAYHSKYVKKIPYYKDCHLNHVDELLKTNVHTLAHNYHLQM